MRPTLTAAALALASTAFSGTATAQYGSAPSSAPQTPAAQGSTPAAAPAKPAMCGADVSSGARPALVAMQAALATKDKAKIAAADAAAQAKVKTPVDNCVLGQMELGAAGAANDIPAVGAATDRIIASGVANGAILAPVLSTVGQARYSTKDYAGALATFNQLAKLTPNDPEPLVLAAETKAKLNDVPGAFALYRQAFAMRARGATIKPDWMARAVSIALSAKSPEVLPLSRDWVTYNPTASNWHDALAIYSEYSNPDDAAAIDIYRLQRATKGLTGSGDYSNYAYSLLIKNLPGEAKAVLDEGLAANIVNPAKAKTLITEANGKVAADKASLAASAATATKSANARAALNVGDAYYGYGDYAKAAAMFRAALGKPGVDTASANLKLGEALTMSGDKAGAKAAFEAVTGARADIAKYWLIYLTQKA